MSGKRSEDEQAGKVSGENACRENPVTGTERGDPEQANRDPDMNMVSAAPARAADDHVPGVSGTKKMPG